jgi:anti-sigma factor RsiW
MTPSIYAVVCEAATYSDFIVERARRTPASCTVMVQQHSPRHAIMYVGFLPNVIMNVAASPIQQLDFGKPQRLQLSWLGNHVHNNLLPAMQEQVLSSQENKLPELG